MPDQTNVPPAIPLRKPKVVGDMGLGSREQMFKLHKTRTGAPEADPRSAEADA